MKELLESNTRKRFFDNGELISNVFMLFIFLYMIHQPTDDPNTGWNKIKLLKTGLQVYT